MWEAWKYAILHVKAGWSACCVELWLLADDRYCSRQIHLIDGLADVELLEQDLLLRLYRSIELGNEHGVAFLEYH